MLVPRNGKHIESRKSSWEELGVCQDLEGILGIVRIGTGIGEEMGQTPMDIIVEREKIDSLLASAKGLLRRGCEDM